MTDLALEVGRTRAIREWPGSWLVITYRANLVYAYHGIEHQGDLYRHLMTDHNPDHVTVVNRIRPGSTPHPVLLIHPKEGRMIASPPETESRDPGIPTLTYTEAVERELKRIRGLADKHRALAFASHYLETLYILRKYRPHQAAPLSASTPAAEVAATLEGVMTRLCKGFAVIERTLVETPDGESGLYTSVDTDQGTTFDYSDNLLGKRWKAWDELALEAYALSTRLAPTPLVWHEVLEPWLTEARLMGLRA